MGQSGRSIAGELAGNSPIPGAILLIHLSLRLFLLMHCHSTSMLPTSPSVCNLYLKILLLRVISPKFLQERVAFKGSKARPLALETINLLQRVRLLFLVTLTNFDGCTASMGVACPPSGCNESNPCLSCLYLRVPTSRRCQRIYFYHGNGSHLGVQGPIGLIHFGLQDGCHYHGKSKQCNPSIHVCMLSLLIWRLLNP